MEKTGSLVCVGTGMRMAGQMTPIALSYIENADVVVAAVPHLFTREWLIHISKRYICLLDHYEDTKLEGKNRRDTYRRMADTILAEVRAGKRVCAAFYGHPGIFACISHMAIRDARNEGYQANMEPGISALDCLVADLGLDPGAQGLIAMETTQFMIYQRQLDPTAMLVLWQIGLAGDLTLKRFDTEPEHLQIVVDKLCRYYSPQHEVIIYEAATNPVEAIRNQRIMLKDLPHISLKQISTLVIPPVETLQFEQEIVDKLKALQAQREARAKQNAENLSD